jgi:hypothetical protein
VGWCVPAVLDGWHMILLSLELGEMFGVTLMLVNCRAPLGLELARERAEHCYVPIFVVQSSFDAATTLFETAT